MAATAEMMAIAREVLPDTVTLVPESPGELTTQGGLDVVGQSEAIRSALEQLEEAGIVTSLFIDPDPRQIEASATLRAPLVELNTAAYAEAVPRGLKEWDEGFAVALENLEEAAELAAGMGLRVLAGHGLTYRNVGPVAAIPEIEELNIGHNIIARAVLVGMERAVREMLAAMGGAEYAE
jgi:pyridoxine 5-phosphate synthase